MTISASMPAFFQVFNAHVGNVSVLFLTVLVHIGIVKQIILIEL